MPHERFQGKSGLGYRGDAILELDWCVGELTKTLERLGLDRNTLIVFCSDNGPVLDDGYDDGAVTKLGEHDPSGDYSGGKYTIFEGGTRTPFVTYWPGRIKPGVSDKFVCTIDLAASMAALAGVALPEGAVIDSFNVLGALLGEAGAEGRPYVLQQPNFGNKLGLRVGQWKLMDQGGKNPKKRYQLYDLSEDVGETVDLAGQYPQRVESMARQIEEIRAAKQTRP
jgi:arylsulfatase A